MLTPALHAALMLAASAPAHRLTRCRGGWHDRPQKAAIVTTRTANALVAVGLAAYDDDALPSALTLTPDGIAEAARAQPMRAAA